MKFLLPLFGVLIVAAPAATICIWNYDTLDRFYDPGLNDSVDCAYWVEYELAAAGHTVSVFADSALPPSIAEYDAVFCLMGWYRC